jgi:hypothetical protein
VIHTVGYREVAPNGEAGRRDGAGKLTLAKTGVPPSCWRRDAGVWIGLCTDEQNCGVTPPREVRCLVHPHGMRRHSSSRGALPCPPRLRDRESGIAGKGVTSPQGGRRYLWSISHAQLLNSVTP